MSVAAASQAPADPLARPLTSQRMLGRAISKTMTNLKKLGKAKITAAVLRSRLTILNSDWQKYQDNHVVIESQATDEQRKELTYFTDNEYCAIEDRYLEITDYLSDLLASTDSPAITETSRVNETSLVASRESNVRLPKIDLPKFSGVYTDWDSFRDMFETLVINNETLSDSQRLQYLKASLIGEPSKLLKNVSITSANYAPAWERLRSRYENMRAIINAHLTDFFSLPAVGTNTVNDLKHVRDTADEIISALRNMERPVDSWDDLIVFFIVSRFDRETRREWEKALGDNTEYPTYKQLSSFMSTQIRTLEAIDTSASPFVKSDPDKAKTGRRKESRSHFATATAKCTLCTANHFLYQCEAFRSKSVAERRTVARDLHCCFNCLRPGHLPRECQSKNVCNKCKKKHHSLLHDDTRVDSSSSNQRQRNMTLNPESAVFVSAGAASSGDNVELNREVSSHFIVGNRGNCTRVLLATAWVRVTSASGRSVNIRALLDQGSETTFVSESVVQLLRAKCRRISTAVTGLNGQHVGDVKNVADLTIGPCSGGHPVIPVHALVLSKITSYTLPKIDSLTQCEHLRGLQLADPAIDNRAPIQLLIGADVYGFTLLSGLKVGPSGTPSAQNTIFGWIVSGPISLGQNRPTPRLTALQCHLQEDINASLQRFWEVEELPRKTFLTDEERRCEEHFVSTHSRATDGRYIVRLPFKGESPPELGDSRTIATASFLRLERRLNCSSDLALAYRDFMLEYERSGHMRLVTHDDLPQASDCFIPHHPVVKEESTTTKVRVVFNASSPIANGTSLNSLLLTGPKLQTDIVAIITRWRTYRFVFSADMEKMFRQIWMDPRDTGYQKIVWRQSPNDPLCYYRLLTVTYGTVSAPFLALRVIQQLIADEGNRFPLAVAVLQKNVYVDDVLFGADNCAALQEIRDQVTALLRAGGFHLRKWKSNSSNLLTDIPVADQDRAQFRSLHDSEGHKVLGIMWSPIDDSFRFRIIPPVI